MSNRSYVIALVKQTFAHLWHTSTQTFVNSVSNNTIVGHISPSCPTTRRASLWPRRELAGAPATNARRVSEANWISSPNNQSLQRLKIAKLYAMQICTIRTISIVFSDIRLRYKLSIIDPRSSQTHSRSGNHHASCSRACVRDIWATVYVVSAICRHWLFHCVNKALC